MVDHIDVIKRGREYSFDANTEAGLAHGNRFSGAAMLACDANAFEGVCIARKHGGARETITVRKTSFGIGVERIFTTSLYHIDMIDHRRSYRCDKERSCPARQALLPAR